MYQYIFDYDDEYNFYDALLKSNNFKLINKFEPDYPFKVAGGYDYGVFVFQRVSEFENKTSSGIIKAYDFEQKINDADSLFVSTDYAFSGKHSYKFNSDKAYSPAVVL